MDIQVLDPPEGDVIARGSYLGGPDYEFVVWDDGRVYFRVVDDVDRVWAGPDPESFRRIATVWNRYQSEARGSRSEADQLKLIGPLREELARFGAFPDDLPPNPEPLWSLLVFEAEEGLG